MGKEGCSNKHNSKLVLNNDSVCCFNQCIKNTTLARKNLKHFIKKCMQNKMTLSSYKKKKETAETLTASTNTRPWARLPLGKRETGMSGVNLSAMRTLSSCPGKIMFSLLLNSEKTSTLTHDRRAIRWWRGRATAVTISHACRKDLHLFPIAKE